MFTSFGDMLRVPGSSTDLLSIKARGGDVRIVYSPLDAVTLAVQNPTRQVVFFAVGFETTAPANAMAVLQAHKLRLDNFSILNAHVLVPPAIRAILSSPTNRVQAFLAAGHVCTVMGFEEYIPLAEEFHAPMVVTGFEPVDILQGIHMAVRQLEAGRADVENQYARAVRREGNPAARAVIEEVFESSDRTWRGIGVIPQSGYRIRERYRTFNAEERFAVDHIEARESPLCIAGSVLQGLRKPHECPAFGRECTPEVPLGAPMVSSEGLPFTVRKTVMADAPFGFGQLFHLRFPSPGIRRSSGSWRWRQADP
jgi:hydrogenase expression/formation protein HypD